MKKIDWDKVWRKYDDWAGIKSRRQKALPLFLWQEKLQSLVEAQLKVKRKKRK